MGASFHPEINYDQGEIALTIYPPDSPSFSSINLPPKSEIILETILYRGELPRNETPALLAVGDRQARRLVSALTDHEVLVSASTRAPLRLAFPARLASRWMPGLFPEK